MFMHEISIFLKNASPTKGIHQDSSCLDNFHQPFHQRKNRSVAAVFGNNARIPIRVVKQSRNYAVRDATVSKRCCNSIRTGVR